MENQTTIFDMLYPKKKITKPIRLIELFGGYGSQALALKYLGVKFEYWKLVEWAIKSIQAYKDIHFNNKYCLGQIPSMDEIIKYLYTKGISNNYNEPMKLEQIKKMRGDKLFEIYNNLLITHNLGNIQQVRGSDLEITDTDKYEYIMTYSFPCQDLSLAGKCKGMSDTTTRSGLLWEVERILTECKNLGELPQILLMENVPQVHSEDDKYKVNKNNLKLNREIACNKTTREGRSRADTSDYIIQEVINTYDEYNHKINGNETIGTIQALYSLTNHGHRLIIKNAPSTTMGGENNDVAMNDLRIRKLTPRECFRLMGVKDEDFDKVAKNQSNSSLYHLAGDSIVVNVLMAIFKELI